MDGLSAGRTLSPSIINMICIVILPHHLASSLLTRRHRANDIRIPNTMRRTFIKTPEEQIQDPVLQVP